MRFDVHTTLQLLRAFDKLADGDTVRIFAKDDAYEVTPKVPSNQSWPQYGGPGLLVLQKQDVTVEGIGWPLIQTTRHGTPIAFHESYRCALRGLHISGNGYVTDPNSGISAFSGILTTRSPFIQITDNWISDVGDQGISELHMDGPEGSHHAVIARNFIERCGMLATPPPFAGDGAGIAVGSWDMDIYDNIARFCFRGLELENSNPANSTSRNRVHHNRFEFSLSTGLCAFVEHRNADLFVDNEIAFNTILGTGAPNKQYPPWGQQEHGITLNGGRRWNVHHNHIENLNDWCAFELLSDKAELTDSILESNTALNCGRGGAWSPCGADRFILRHNRIQCPHSAGPAVNITGKDCVLDGNLITPIVSPLNPATGTPWPRVMLNGTVVEQ